VDALHLTGNHCLIQHLTRYHPIGFLLFFDNRTNLLMFFLLKLFKFEVYINGVVDPLLPVDTPVVVIPFCPPKRSVLSIFSTNTPRIPSMGQLGASSSKTEQLKKHSRGVMVGL
jgi:hypothetical protein